jgi:hypothetical protein
VTFVDDYCQWYQSLFPEVRSLEAFKRKFPRDALELPPETITRWEFPAFGNLCSMTTFVETLMWRWFQLFLAESLVDPRKLKIFLNYMTTFPAKLKS